MVWSAKGVAYETSTDKAPIPNVTSQTQPTNPSAFQIAFNITYTILKATCTGVDWLGLACETTHSQNLAVSGLILVYTSLWFQNISCKKTMSRMLTGNLSMQVYFLEKL